MRYDQVREILDELDVVLADEGVHAALAFLNARAPHRFTGIYRLDSPTLRSVSLFDRSNPLLQVGADAPLRETYCSITGQGGAHFSTPDSRSDEGLEDHPARDSTLSYCGVPLLDESGKAIGTLCHFDLVPRPVPDSEVALMQGAAERILRELRRRGAFSSPA